MALIAQETATSAITLAPSDRLRVSRGGASAPGEAGGERVLSARQDGCRALLLRRWPGVPAPRVPAPRKSGSEPSAPPPRWCVEQSRDIERGAAAYLIESSPAAGLVARGSVVCAPFLGPRWDRIGTVGQHVTVSWNETLGPTQAVPLDVLRAELPGWDWVGSGFAAELLPIEFTPRLALLWRRWCEAHRPTRRLGEWVRAGASRVGQRPPLGPAAAPA